MLWISYRNFSFHHAMWLCPVERIAARFLPHSKRLDNMEAVGAIFFPFVFRFLTYLLSCILFLSLSGILLITLLCYVLYVNFVIVCYLALFITSFYVSISVTTFVEVDYLFPRWP